MTVVIIIGAGASFGSGDCLPQCPPLGSQLFAAMRLRGGVASRITGDLADLFQRDFEAGMAEFRATRDIDTTAFLREMADYLVDFRTGPRNLLHDLVRTIRDSQVPTVLVTTNYDLLLEQAITEAGLLVAYHSPPVPERNISLLKIHGSCHFLPAVPGVLRGVEFRNCGVNVEAPIRIACSRAEVKEFCAQEDSLAPAISVYAPGKAVLFSPAIVKEHQAAWASVLRGGPTRIYCIGLRLVAHDEHIWAPIADARVPFSYGGFEGDDFLTWAAANQVPRPRVIGKTFAEALPLLLEELRNFQQLDA